MSACVVSVLVGEGGDVFIRPNIPQIKWSCLSPLNHVGQHISIQVGGEVIWESLKEKLLGVTIDKPLKMNPHVSDLVKKAGTKVTILSRFSHIMPFARKKVLMNAIILSQSPMHS